MLNFVLVALPSIKMKVKQKTNLDASVTSSPNQNLLFLHSYITFSQMSFGPDNDSYLWAYIKL